MQYIYQDLFKKRTNFFCWFSKSAFTVMFGGV